MASVLLDYAPVCRPRGSYFYHLVHPGHLASPAASLGGTGHANPFKFAGLPVSLCCLDTVYRIL